MYLAYSGLLGNSNFVFCIFHFRPKMSGPFIFFYFSAEKGKSFYGRPLVHNISRHRLTTRYSTVG